MKRTISLLVFFTGFIVQQSYAQVYTPISGVINDYVSVTAILSSQDWNPDSVVVVSATDFNVGDTVMLYCVKGATIGTGDPSYTPGDPLYPAGNDAQNPRNTGRYAFLLVSEKIGNTLVFNTIVNPGIRPMGAGEMAQLIRVRSYRYANVTAAGLTAPAWDPIAGTGGVVTLFVQGILRLDGDIDVSGDGFKGAQGSMDTEYAAGCSSTDTMSFYEPFYMDGELWAGLKGEGITDTQFLYNRGKASNINGGGGGNGLLAGGGGGSNFTAGIRGGSESTACSSGVSVTGGDGGFDLGRSGWYYINNNLDRTDRIFFGGGGGSGTRTIASTSTDGGNGGGIVVIVAEIIYGNGGGIYADGEDVVGIAVNAAGAGGGGGGCIILDVTGYQGTIPLSSVGGDGGNSSSTGTDTTGMGGAGGGGIYWTSGSSNPPVLQTSFATGANGVFLSAPPYDPLESPRSPFQQDDLIVPLRGFLFNPLPTEYTVCSDQDPQPIYTSDPRAGDGTDTYQWIDSSSTQNYWADITGAVDMAFDPGPLSDTTYYRRIVTSAGISDTSFRIAIYVHPSITNNIISASDTIYSGDTPKLFEPAATIGGGPTGGYFTYVWQHQPDSTGSFTDLTEPSEEPGYQADKLTNSTNYRRIAFAGVCESISNEDRVLVLDTITGMDIRKFGEPLAIYPNPVAEGLFYFNKRVSGTIYNMMGQKLMELDDTEYARIPQLGEGFYIFRSQEGESIQFIVTE